MRCSLGRTYWNWLGKRSQEIYPRCGPLLRSTHCIMNWPALQGKDVKNHSWYWAWFISHTGMEDQVEHIVLRVFHAVSSVAYFSKCTVTVMAACNFVVFWQIAGEFAWICKISFGFFSYNLLTPQWRFGLGVNFILIIYSIKIMLSYKSNCMLTCKIVLFQVRLDINVQNR